MIPKIAVGKILRKKKLTLAIAESCTGGLISNLITDASGSSDYFKLGIVAYSNRAKEKILGVSFRQRERPSSVIARRPKADCFTRHCESAEGGRSNLKNGFATGSAISKQVALEMANGVRLLAGTDIGIGVTGIAGPKPLASLGYRAGPTGGTKSKPVGLIYIALVTNKKHIVKEFHFKGSRLKIKSQAAQAALQLLIRLVGHP